jgi:cholest-4-en-3-one 26-monooxygenase
MTIEINLAGRGPRVVDEPRFSSSPFEPELPPVERLEDVDLTDPNLYLRGDPHATWKLLREQAPVFWHEKGARGTRGQGFWAVTTYEGCSTVHRQSEVFSNSHTEFLDLLPEDIPLQLSSMDPPEHSKYRRILQRFFTPKALERVQGEVGGLVSFILDGAAHANEVDFLTAIAQPLPFLATCQLLQIAPEDAQALAGQLQSISYDSPDALTQFVNAVMDFFDQITLVWPHDPEDSLIAAVLAGEVDGRTIPKPEALAYLWVLFLGALDTTTHSASTGLLSLFHHPDQFEKLKANPELLPSAIEEMLRWGSTSNVVKHVALTDTELGGFTIRAGDYVATYPPSACRDEAAFPEPYRFDITRTMGNPIFTFGGGPHLCLGAHFARLELRSLFSELIRRFPGIASAGPAVRGEAFTLTLSPLKALPVRLQT